MLTLSGPADDLFATGQNEQLAAAYRRRARAVAFRAKRACRGGGYRSGDRMMLASVRTLLIVLAGRRRTRVRPGRHVSRSDTAGHARSEAAAAAANPEAPSTPAKELFARKATPFPGPARSIGGYADGCLGGALRAADHGPRLAGDAAIAQSQLGQSEAHRLPRTIRPQRARRSAGTACWSATCRSRAAARCITGHASHQIGLDADIWFTPMPDHVLSREEREFNGAVNMVRSRSSRRRSQGMDATRSTQLVRAAAQDPVVTRIFVNAAIKKAMCSEAGIGSRMAVRRCGRGGATPNTFMSASRCPADSPECKPQPPPDAGDGCGHELDYWFKDSMLHPTPPLDSAEAEAPDDHGWLAAGMQCRSSTRPDRSDAGGCRRPCVG